MIVRRLNGLGVWFSLWVREVPGSNPGWAHFSFHDLLLIPVSNFILHFYSESKPCIFNISMTFFFYFRISLYFCSFRCLCRIFPCTDPTAHIMIKNPKTLYRFLQTLQAQIRNVPDVNVLFKLIQNHSWIE